MGLDLALGGLILIIAFRGWIRGFAVQAIRLGGIVGAVYAAVPVRDFAKPYAAQYLPTIRADLSDRILWWAAAATCYFLFVGVASMLVAVGRKNTFGLEEKNRSDQFAGFGLGIVKGLIIASFTVGTMQKYESLVTRVDWAASQMKESNAWDLNQKYQPSQKIWASPPVQQFVAHIQKYGLNAPARSEVTETPEKPSEEPKPVQTASRAPKLVLPDPDGGEIQIDPADLDDQLLREVQELQRLQRELNHLSVRGGK